MDRKIVSMKSGLEGRNNPCQPSRLLNLRLRLNEVRPRRPEQSEEPTDWSWENLRVSMKSGLEGRNNFIPALAETAHWFVSMKSGLEGRNNWGPRLKKCSTWRLNEGRPRRPEQSAAGAVTSGTWIFMSQ